MVLHQLHFSSRSSGINLLASENQLTTNIRANKARLINRWGCSVGHAFRNFNPPSRLDAHPRPSGASA
jgi:hypothetical protein